MTTQIILIDNNKIQTNDGVEISFVSTKLEVENHSQFAELTWTSLEIPIPLLLAHGGAAAVQRSQESISRPWENLRREEPKAQEFRRLVASMRSNYATAVQRTGVFPLKSTLSALSAHMAWLEIVELTSSHPDFIQPSTTNELRMSRLVQTPDNSFSSAAIFFWRDSLGILVRL